MTMRTIEHEGEQTVGVDIPFTIEQDGNVRLRLEDGALLRVRPVVVAVMRTEKKNPDGERVYVVHSFIHVAVDERAKEDVT